MTQTDAASKVKTLKAQVDDPAQLTATARAFARRLRALRSEAYDLRGGVTITAWVLRDDTIPEVENVPPDTY
jgi:hypothetical protein